MHIFSCGDFMHKVTLFGLINISKYSLQVCVVTVLLIPYQQSLAVSDCSIESVGFERVNGTVDCWECPKCEHGMGLSIECGRNYKLGTKLECQSCKKGITYSNTRDIGQCRQCQQCNINEETNGKCTEFKDTITCKCKPGYYRDPVNKDCVSCSKCCVDNRIIQLPVCNSSCSLGSACAITESLPTDTTSVSKKQFNETKTLKPKTKNESYDMGKKTAQPDGKKNTTNTTKLSYFALFSLILVPISIFGVLKVYRTNSPPVADQRKYCTHAF